MLLMSLIATAVLAGPSPFSHPLASTSVGAPLELAPSSRPAPFGLALPPALRSERPRTYRRRTTVWPYGPMASAHRPDERGPVILTEDGPLHCEGHRFPAAPAAK